MYPTSTDPSVTIIPIDSKINFGAKMFQAIKCRQWIVAANMLAKTWKNTNNYFRIENFQWIFGFEDKAYYCCIIKVENQNKEQLNVNWINLFRKYLS